MATHNIQKPLITSLIVSRRPNWQPNAGVEASFNVPHETKAQVMAL
jgi:hypothetical protein